LTKKDLLKKFIKWCCYLLIILLVVALSLVAPIDYTPLTQQPFYRTMMKRIDTIEFAKSSPSAIQIGWSKVNLVPRYPMPMAGYTPKNKYESIHDSVFCRILAIQQKKQSYFIISADLLLFPPSVKERIQQRLKDQGKNYFLYFSATHTHSSLGGWDESIVGRITLGKYHEEWINTTVEQILSQMEVARKTSLDAKLAYFEVEAKEYVENRLNAKGSVDNKIRGIKVIRSDSSRALLTTFSAHATNVELLSRIISGDYPSALTEKLERKVDFSIFLSGMVGSHRLTGIQGNGFERIDTASTQLAAKIEQAVPNKIESTISIIAKHIPIDFGPAQLRIEKNWKIRNWVFGSLLRPLAGEFTWLQLGSIILLGTPCDFSGEIYVDQRLGEIVSNSGNELIITSFNGTYTGYITADRYYNAGKEEEVMALNWVGPYFGQYYSEMIKEVMKKKGRAN
jgi:neutral ceramidase